MNKFDEIEYQARLTVAAAGAKVLQDFYIVELGKAFRIVAELQEKIKELEKKENETDVV